MGTRRILILVVLALLVLAAVALVLATWDQGPPTRSGAVAFASAAVS